MKMLLDGSSNDVCIKLHDGEIKANKSVLAKRCKYFAATFRWKSNNNHDVEEIVVNDCSTKIMKCIIEYFFSGILKAKDLHLLDFLELKDQVQKILPGDELEEMIEKYLEESSDARLGFGFSFPTNEEIVKALSLVESGNLNSQVIVEFRENIEKGKDSLGKVAALASLVYHGVMTSIEKVSLCSHSYGNLDDSLDTIAGHDILDDIDDIERSHFEPLDLGLLPVDHLQALVPCVTGSVHITNVTDYDMTSLLDSLHCKELHLTQRLNQEETEALVRAMTSHVEILHLGSKKGMVSLDVDTLTKYKGDGKCREVRCVWIKVTPDVEDEGDQVHGGGGATGDVDPFEDDDTYGHCRRQWIDYMSTKRWAKEMNWIQSNIEVIEDEKIGLFGYFRLKVIKMKLEKPS